MARANRGRTEVLLGAVATIVVLAGWSHAGGEPQFANPANPGVAPAYIPGVDYVSVSCEHGAIYLSGDLVCHDQVGVNVGVCGGSAGTVCSYTLLGVPDLKYKFGEFAASGDSCLGTYPTCHTSSTTDPTSYYGMGEGSGDYAGTLAMATSPADVEGSCFASSSLLIQHLIQITGTVHSATGGYFPGTTSCSSNENEFGVVPSEGVAYELAETNIQCSNSICVDVPGISSFTGWIWFNASAPFAYTLPSTAFGSASATFAFTSWEVESFTGGSAQSCADGDNAGGGATVFVTITLETSAGSIVGQSTDDYFSVQGSCASAGATWYSVGGVEFPPGTPSFQVGVNSLALAQGDSYTLDVSVGCAYNGATTGNNMATDSDTEATTLCGEELSPAGSVYVSSAELAD